MSRDGRFSDSQGQFHTVIQGERRIRAHAPPLHDLPDSNNQKRDECQPTAETPNRNVGGRAEAERLKHPNCSEADAGMRQAVHTRVQTNSTRFNRGALRHELKAADFVEELIQAFNENIHRSRSDHSLRCECRQWEKKDFRRRIDTLLRPLQPVL